MKFPIFIENSKVPVWLSKIAPIEIGAISFGLWVWDRGISSERRKVHETIHFKQQVELLFVFQWILYGLFWIIGLVKYRNGEQAYYESPFEREAYQNDNNPNYLNGGSDAVTDARNISIKVFHSLIKMPDNNYEIRYEDPKVGYFTTQTRDMTSTGTTDYRDTVSYTHLTLPTSDLV